MAMAYLAAPPRLLEWPIQPSTLYMEDVVVDIETDTKQQDLGVVIRTAWEVEFHTPDVKRECGRVKRHPNIPTRDFTMFMRTGRVSRELSGSLMCIANCFVAPCWDGFG
jgi:hypothetical protein